MAQRFTPAQEKAIRDLLSSPERVQSLGFAQPRPLYLVDVCKALELPPVPYHRYLSQDCWTGGGAVLRWLCSSPTGKNWRRGDVDLFFPSLEALKRTLYRLLSDGHCLYGVQTLRGFAKELPLPDGSGVWRVPSASDQVSSFSWLTPELVRRTGLKSFQLRSPEAMPVDIIALLMKPTPQEVASSFDLTICGFVADDQRLYSSPMSWSDLLENRIRFQRMSAVRLDARLGAPRETRGLNLDAIVRLCKYAARGFRPGFRTLLDLPYYAGVRIKNELRNRRRRV
jgi:hypothetical protein